MSQVRQFEYPADLFIINRWRAGRGLEALHLGALPPCGFITNSAAVFLYKTDSLLAFVEELVTNPEAPIRERSRDIDRVILAAINYARSCGFAKVYGITAKESVEARVTCRLGFKSLGTHLLLERDL